MLQRPRTATNWMTAALLTLALLAPAAVEARPAGWSQSNRAQYAGAKRAQKAKLAKAQANRARSRQQRVRFQNRNTKKLQWTRQNKARASRHAKARARKAHNRLGSSSSAAVSAAGAKPAAAAARKPLRSRIDRQTRQADKKRTGGDFARHQASARRLKARAEALKAEAHQTNNPSLMRQSVAARALGARHEVKMWRAEAAGLRSKARASTPKRAKELLKRAVAIDGRAAKREQAIARYVRHYSGKLPKQATDRAAAPGVDGQAAKAAAAGLASRRGAKQVKLQLKNGSFMGAVATLQQMEQQPRRRGPMRLVDSYRKARTRGRILNKSYKQGKRAARAGDLAITNEALAAISHDVMKQSDRARGRKFERVARAAVGNPYNPLSRRGAKGMAKRDPQQAYQLLQFAREVRAHIGRKQDTVGFKLVRRKASKAAWKTLGRMAKEGNIEGFRAASMLIEGYAMDKKPGVAQPLSSRQEKRINKLYRTVQKRSVTRALDDAKLLLTGKLGYVNTEEAAKRLAYAEETANVLAQRGVAVKSGLFRRSAGREIRTVRKKLFKAFAAENNQFATRPGLLKRMFEKWSKQPHRRSRPSVAALDSVWQEKQQEQAMAEQGITPQMLAQMQAQQAASGGQGQPVNTPKTLVQVRQGE